MVTTVLNEATGCSVLLDSLADQTRTPDEIIVVDGGSTDGTLAILHAAAERDERILVIEAPGANIGQGRNLGARAAAGDVIVSTDTGCRLDSGWVEAIVRPFEDDPNIEFVAGSYRIDAHTWFEEVVGAATMRGVLEPIDPESFNPSCRSMAYTKALWERAGGLPEWTPIDDNLFNAKLRRMAVARSFASDAVVFWRPRSTLGGVYRQFRFYASTTGHTQLEAGPTRYNLRNLLLCGALLAAGFFYWPLWILLTIASLYWYVGAFHAKALRVARRMGSWPAYPTAIAIYWALLLGDTVGYVRASIGRVRRRSWYRRKVAEYLAVPASPAG
ncbi:MAG: glycosyltransferase [bacterium]|nr:glycosyltransferase [bacterium]